MNSNLGRWSTGNIALAGDRSRDLYRTSGHGLEQNPNRLQTMHSPCRSARATLDKGHLHDCGVRHVWRSTTRSRGNVQVNLVLEHDHLDFDAAGHESQELRNYRWTKVTSRSSSTKISPFGRSVLTRTCEEDTSGPMSSSCGDSVLWNPRTRPTPTTRFRCFFHGRDCTRC